jgi:hypothetical protein
MLGITGARNASLDSLHTPFQTAHPTVRVTPRPIDSAGASWPSRWTSLQVLVSHRMTVPEAAPALVGPDEAILIMAFVWWKSVFFLGH